MSRAGTVVERLLEDDTVHDYLSDALVNLQRTASLASRRGAEAAADERSWANLGKAVASLRAAAARIAGAEEPQPERVGGFGSVLLLGVGVAMIVTGLRAGRR